MDYCYIQFNTEDSESLNRTQQIFELIRKMKSGEVNLDEACITASFNEAERSYFWTPSPEERAKWNDHWKNTPVAVRISSAMVLPQWDIESMYDAIWNGEYELIGISQENGSYFLAFNPEAYPFGGVSCMIAFLECFGHEVIGYNDGTGYVSHKPRTVWLPSVP